MLCGCGLNAPFGAWRFMTYLLDFNVDGEIVKS